MDTWQPVENSVGVEQQAVYVSMLGCLAYPVTHPLYPLIVFAAAQVNDNYLDARSSGWDRSRWAQLRDEALAKRYSDTTTVHRWLFMSEMCMQSGTGDALC